MRSLICVHLSFLKLLFPFDLVGMLPSYKTILLGIQFLPGSTSEVLVTSADSRIRVIEGVEHMVHKFKGTLNCYIEFLCYSGAEELNLGDARTEFKLLPKVIIFYCH